MFDLALRLNKTVGEIGRMSAREFAEWISYFGVLAEEKKRAEMDAAAIKSASEVRSKVTKK